MLSSFRSFPYNEYNYYVSMIILLCRVKCKSNTMCVCVNSYIVLLVVTEKNFYTAVQLDTGHRSKGIGMSESGRERVYVRVNEKEWEGGEQESERETPRARHCSSVVLCTLYAIHTQCTVRVPLTIIREDTRQTA